AVLDELLEDRLGATLARLLAALEEVRVERVNVERVLAGRVETLLDGLLDDVLDRPVERLREDLLRDEPPAELGPPLSGEDEGDVEPEAARDHDVRQVHDLAVEERGKPAVRLEKVCDGGMPRRRDVDVGARGRAGIGGLGRFRWHLRGLGLRGRRTAAADEPDPTHGRQRQAGAGTSEADEVARRDAAGNSRAV